MRETNVIRINVAERLKEAGPIVKEKRRALSNYGFYQKDKKGFALNEKSRKTK